MLFGRRKEPLVMIVLDGWGIAPAWGGNAISQAKTKNFDLIWQNYPSTLLDASGIEVGLPANSQGNSEAGHLNIGAGHVVKQDAGLINAQIEDKTFFDNSVLLGSIEHAKKNNSNIHLMGLLSNAGTHSDINHLYSLLQLFKDNDFKKVYIHFFSDGRDSPPMAGIEVAEQVEKKILEIGVGKVASLSGRFYAMDRDNRWGRIARAYNMLVKYEGDRCENLRAAFSSAYKAGMTDEFIEPRMICNTTQEIVPITNGDAIILFNYRSDRAKEITEAFSADKISQFPDRKKLENIYFASFVIYQDGIPGHQVFKPEKVAMPLAKVWSDKGLQQYHSAETEKFPHITYFINGGNEAPFPGEKRVMIPSVKTVRTYDYCPQMSAGKVTEHLLFALRTNVSDAFMINFANPDMVGHTGNLKATVQAVEYVDLCLGKILSYILNTEATCVVLADHGNAEQMVNPQTGMPDTEHTTNPVPFIIFSNDIRNKSLKLADGGKLASVAPTVLDLMGMEKPEGITEKSLIMNE